MNEKPRVETVEEFKLRIAAIISGKPEQITGAPRPHTLLSATQQTRDPPESKAPNDPLTAVYFIHIYEVGPTKINVASIDILERSADRILADE